jgi:hypothetical protein
MRRAADAEDVWRTPAAPLQEPQVAAQASKRQRGAWRGGGTGASTDGLMDSYAPHIATIDPPPPPCLLPPQETLKPAGPGALPRTGNPNPGTTMPQSERAMRSRSRGRGPPRRRPPTTAHQSWTSTKRRRREERAAGLTTDGRRRAWPAAAARWVRAVSHGTRYDAAFRVPGSCVPPIDERVRDGSKRGTAVTMKTVENVENEMISVEKRNEIFFMKINCYKIIKKRF